MPVMGQGFGVRLAEGLDAVDQGVDWAQEQRRRQGVRAQTQENLRGAGIRNDNAITEEARRQEGHEIDAERSRLGIRLDTTTVKEAERTDAWRDENQALRESERLAEVQARTAESNRVVDTTPSQTDSDIAGNKRDAIVAGQEGAAARRLAEREERGADADDRADYSYRLFKAAEAENSRMDELNQLAILQEFGTDAEYEKARVDTSLKSMASILAIASTAPKQVPELINGSPMFDIGDKRAVGFRIDGTMFRAIDEDGNVVRERDGDEVEFDTKNLSADMMKTFFGAEYDRTQAGIKALQESQKAAAAQRAKTSKATDPDKHASDRRKATNEHLAASYSLYPDEDGNLEGWTALMESEAREIQSRASARARVEDISYSEALNKERKHPDLVKELIAMGGTSAGIERYVLGYIADAKRAGHDATRLSALQGLYDKHAKGEQQ